jgi:L-arabinokinase
VLGVGEGRPIVLASFGGYGLDLPHDEIARRGRLELLTGERDAPHGLHYEDLVAAADVIVSKPGYGIVSDCLANETALLYTSRGRFAEYDVFVDQMPRFLKCRYISQDDLLAGRWADAVEALIGQPPPPERPRTDGAEVAAARILGWLDTSKEC